MTKKTGIIENGKERFENTPEFNLEVAKIKRDIKNKYASDLSKTSTWIQRLLIYVQMRMEIRKAVLKLSSTKNLHLVTLHPF